MGRKARHLLIWALLVSLAGCGFYNDEALTAKYKLVAVDAREQMALCWDEGDGVSSFLAGPTLFSAGYDRNYVVAAIHPKGEKAVTQYFYIVRNPKFEARRGPSSDDIHGPFNAQEYSKESARLRLPPFTRTFDDLK
ncbi:hypothetical protein [Rhizomicrobium electricum]|nr:hypothetical protein [Rhizomicrobium electricum]NIJ48511.1 hypothetical protein [Rhizomicrobium electricum]